MSGILTFAFGVVIGLFIMDEKRWRQHYAGIRNMPVDELFPKPDYANS